MSDDLKERLAAAYRTFEAAGVEGVHGAREMRDALDRIEALESLLAEARAAQDVAVAAALEEAADLIERESSFMSQHMMAQAIRVLIPKDGADAMDRVKAEAQAEGMREARSMVLGFTMLIAPESVPMREASEAIRRQCARAILAAIEKGEG